MNEKYGAEGYLNRWTINNLFKPSIAIYSTSADASSPDKKWSFPLRISSVNVTKSIESCGFGHI